MLGTLTQPNACSGRLCDGTFNAYRFPLYGVALGSGSYTVVVSATDGDGSTREVNVPVNVSNPPTLQVAAPADGAIVFGQLQVSGTTATDKAGAVTVTVRIGDVEILNTTQSSFSTAYDITGLTPGNYTVTVRAVDNTNTVTQIQRTVVVASQATLALQPVSTLAAGAQVLAAEGSKLLIRASDQSLQVRDLVGGTATALQSAGGIQYAAGWQFGGQGSVVAYGKDAADCVLYCIYRWDAAGTRTNLTNANPFSQATNIGGGWAYDQHPVARDGHVVWVNDKAADTGAITNASGRYTVFNVGAGTYTRVGVPTGVNYVGNWSYDFAVVGGVVRFWFWGQTGGEGVSSTFDIFEWRSDTDTTTRITQAGVRSIYVQTDGVRAAWQQSPLGGNTDSTYTLVQRSLAGGAGTAVASQVSQSQLRDGVLAWLETTPTSRALRAATTAQTTTLSVLSTANLLAVGEGAVVYSEQGKLYLWKASTPAVSSLLLDATPSGVWIAGGHVVFTLGTGIHRVSL